MNTKKYNIKIWTIQTINFWIIIFLIIILMYLCYWTSYLYLSSEQWSIAWRNNICAWVVANLFVLLLSINLINKLLDSKKNDILVDVNMEQAYKVNSRINNLAYKFLTILYWDIPKFDSTKGPLKERLNAVIMKEEYSISELERLYKNWELQDKIKEVFASSIWGTKLEEIRNILFGYDDSIIDDIEKEMDKIYPRINPDIKEKIISACLGLHASFSMLQCAKSLRDSCDGVWWEKTEELDINLNNHYKDLFDWPLGILVENLCSVSKLAKKSKLHINI